MNTPTTTSDRRRNEPRPLHDIYTDLAAACDDLDDLRSFARTAVEDNAWTDQLKSVFTARRVEIEAGA